MLWLNTTDVEDPFMEESPAPRKAQEGMTNVVPFLHYADLKADLLNLLDRLSATLQTRHESNRPPLSPYSGAEETDTRNNERWPSKEPLHCAQTSYRDLHDHLAAERFYLATVGEFKRGKTTLVNALLGEALLPMGVTPLTSVATVISFGKVFSAWVHFQNGPPLSIERAELASYVTETSNPGNTKGVREVVIEFPAPLLRNGLRLLDTPGVGSIHHHNTAAAHAILPHCDAALFLLSADQPLSRAELEFLEKVRGHAQRIFFLLNKIDYLKQEELEEVLHFTRHALSEILEGEVRLFPVSARQALKGGGWMDAGLHQQSRLPVLVQALEDFLLEEKGKVLLLGISARCARLLAATRLEWEIARRSLAEPPEELQGKLRAFRNLRNHQVAERNRRVQDFRGRMERLIKSCLDPHLRQQRTAQETRLLTQFQNDADEHRDLPPNVLDEVLAAFVADEVAATVAAMAMDAEQVITPEFTQDCQVFSSGVKALMEELQNSVADLFQLPHLSPSGDAGWLPEPQRILAVEPDPAGLALLSEWIVRDGTVWLGRRFRKVENFLLRWANRRIVARHRQNLLDSLDLHLGRLRYHFLKRLEIARQHYTEQTVHEYENAANGIAITLEQALEERTRDADFLEQRRRLLNSQLAQLEDYMKQLDCIRRDAECL